MKKSDREIMEILEASDATGCAHSAAGIANVDPKTVRRYVAARDEGPPVTSPAAADHPPGSEQDRRMGGPLAGQGPRRRGS